jgi:hypothetical protein
LDLETYFSRDPEGRDPRLGHPGHLTGWMLWGPFDVRGRNVLIVDPHRGPDARQGVLLRLAPGEYDVSLKIMEFAGDRRVARLRFARAGKRPRLGPELGQVACETARLGFCDHELAAPAWERLGEEEAFQRVETELRDSRLVGFVELDAAAEIAMPFVDTGLGDGSFPVYELLAADIRVGFEVELIRDGARYPFGVPVTPGPVVVDQHGADSD